MSSGWKIGTEGWGGRWWAGLVVTACLLLSTFASLGAPAEPAAGRPSKPDDQGEAVEGSEKPATGSSQSAGERAKDSPLVRAARSARQDAARGTRRRLTSKDATNSRGQLIELGTANDDRSLAETDDALGGADPAGSKGVGRNARIRQIKSRIEALTEELRSLEEQYYVEQDPAIRAGIEQEFEARKKDLARQKEALALDPLTNQHDDGRTE